MFFRSITACVLSFLEETLDKEFSFLTLKNQMDYVRTKGSSQAQEAQEAQPYDTGAVDERVLAKTPF
jgi:hypothetical protein